MALFEQLTLGRYSKELEEWIAAPPQELESLDEFSVATYNIWFSINRFEERCEAILSVLDTCDADIIGLQEVRPESLQFILQEKWVQESFFISNFSARTVEPYGTVILSRLPVFSVVSYSLPSEMHRRFLVAEIKTRRGTFRFGNLHLESHKQSASTRKEQLATIFPSLKGSDASLLFGDFNMCATWDENSLILPSYKDVWTLLHPDEPGFTKDTELNPMLLQKEQKAKRVRFDRILVSSHSISVNCREVRLIGTRPVSPLLSHVYPSDHFGLVARFSVTD